MSCRPGHSERAGADYCADCRRDRYQRHRAARTSPSWLDGPRLDRAGCADAVARGFAHPDDWHPSLYGSREPAAVRAKLICSTCPELLDCLAWSLQQPAALAGIWGGIGRRGRQALRAALP
jgi:hypothetical protein